MLEELKSAQKVVGLKQSRKALRDGEAERVYLASNAEERLIAPIVAVCQELGVEYVTVETMELLGSACGVEVGASVVTVLKSRPI